MAQSLEPVMENFFAKIGGKEKIVQINSSKETSFNWVKTINSNDPETSKSIKTRTVIKAPYSRKFVSFDAIGNIDNEFFYNEKGAVFAMGSVIEKKSGETKVSVCAASDLLNWYTKYKLTYIGEKMIGGEDYYKIRKDDGNNIEFFYFSKETHLLVASQLADWPDRITYYKKYEITNAIMQPFLLESYQNDVIYYKQITESYEFNPEIDSKIFYFNENEYKKTSVSNVKYRSIKLKTKETEFNEFIKANFDGKRIFLDFWATWCAPCKKEFKSYDSAYYSFMESNNINLVYLSIDSDEDKKIWEADIERLGLKGYHARANRKLIQSIQSLVFDGSTIVIPRYVLINEYGMFLSKDFNRPSEPEFKNKIEQALKLNK